MKNLLPFLLAVSAFAQTATITDTIYTPFGGTFGGTVTVSLNSPALAQPLYSGNVTLSGWTQTVTVTAGAFTLTLYTNDLITPGGTSYTATFAPNAGSSWKETWIVPTGATTIREIRSTTVPSPLVRFTPSQITQAGATLNQVLRWNGSTWAPATAAGGGSGTVTSVSVATANGVSGTVANPTTTPAITLSLGAITPTSVAATGTVSGSNLSGTNTGDQTNITGNAGTATALAANGTNCSAGSYPLGVDASGNAEGCTAAVTASTGLSDSSDIVRGASTLTTVGSVPFVTSAGVLGQSANFRFFSGTGNLVVGTTTDGGFKLDVAASGSAGTARFYGGAGVSNSTKVVVQAGGGQSGNLTEWQASNGTTVSGISTSGLSLGTTAFPALFVIASSSGQMLYVDNNSVSLNSPGNLGWTASVNATSAKDLSLSRASANTLQVGDGGANSNGDLAYREWRGTARTFANLGTPANGTFVFCSDCTVANPCASGGTGAFARRLNAAWVCSDGGGGASGPTACEIVVGDPGAATPILADDNDTPAVCANVSGTSQTITSIACWAHAGSPTVRPIITGGALNSLLSSDLTCGPQTYAPGTLNGTPTLAAGQTIDANIASAGGVAKYIVIRITRQ